MPKILLFFAAIIAFSPCFAQNSTLHMDITDTLPYFEIPAYPDSFSAETAVARMIDGLGFRYYWATDSLRPEDLAFRPTPESRSSEETIDHILGLSKMILNAIKSEPNTKSGEETSPLTFEIKRKQTLLNLKAASDLLKSGQYRLEDGNVILKGRERAISFPFWNAINGPISDALWHVGQVVTFRRSSGNPFNKNVNVLTGNKK